MMQGGLGVGDGFKFGCGFMLAGIIAWIAIAIIALILSLVLGLSTMLPFMMQNTM